MSLWRVFESRRPFTHVIPTAVPFAVQLMGVQSYVLSSICNVSVPQTQSSRSLGARSHFAGHPRQTGMIPT